MEEEFKNVGFNVSYVYDEKSKLLYKNERLTEYDELKVKEMLNDSSNPIVDTMHCAIRKGKVYNIYGTFSKFGYVDAFFAMQQVLIKVFKEEISLEQMLDKITKSVCYMEGVDCSGIYIMNQFDQTLNLISHSGISEAFLKKVSTYKPTNHLVCELRKGKPIYGYNELFENDKEIASEINYFVSVPFIDDGNLVACLNIGSYKGIIDERIVDQIIILSNMIGTKLRQKFTSQMLEESLSDIDVLFEEITDLVFIVNKEGKVLKTNGHKGHDFLGGNQNIVDMNILDLHDIAPKQKVIDTINEVLEGNEKQFVVKMPFGKKNAPTLEIKLARGRWNGENVIIGLARDISRSVQDQKEIMYLSYHDVLTDLNNRHYFETKAKLLDYPYSIIMIDLNGLKMINDAFGHEKGDLLLKRTGKILKTFYEKGMIIARWGGDEFTMLVPITDKEKCEELCLDISNAFSKIDIIDGKLSVSIGYAISKESVMDFSSLMKKAEDSMYKNKLLMEKSYRSSIISYVKETLFAKSYETQSHANRLRRHAKQIAKKLGFSSNEIDEMELFSMLHDIGKIGVSDSILTKKEKLSNEDWEEIKKHPQIGYSIAKSIPDIAHIAEFILSHHEHIDGSGYPRGLKGDEIPVQARILAVVDAYDAMTHNRAYRRALAKNVAIEELVKNKGTQFDSEIVDIYIDVLGSE